MPAPQQISRVIVPAASFALISVDQAKDALGITASDTSQDGKVGQQIAQVSAAINRHCDRVFVRQTYRDYFRDVHASVTWGQPLMLRHAPVCLDVLGNPVLVVTEDGAVIDTAGWEVNHELGAIYRLDAAIGITDWLAVHTIVDYEAGFDLIPEDVQAAALAWLTARWTQIGHDPSLRSMSIPDVIIETYNTSAPSSSATPAAVLDILGSYRRWTL